jgi:hypothetical protein
MPEDITRSQLAGNCRAFALRLFWFDQKPGSLHDALEEARKLLIAVTAYEQALSEEIAECHHENQEFLPYPHPDRPDGC